VKLREPGMTAQTTILVVFLLTLGITYAVALYARSVATVGADEELAGRNLNRWLVGLSAGTTGNSGFIVTGAVGLGYSGGVHWIMLPICWLFGDLIYWALFPDKLNALARRAHATTLSELLTYDLRGNAARILAISASTLLTIFLSGYTAAQWLAGEKFLGSAFALTTSLSLAIFGLSIVLYSSIGGFRGSVYTDMFQAFIRVLGTLVAVGAVIYVIYSDRATFWINIKNAGEGFLMPFPSMSIINVLGFVLGFACAAIGFGLGQPQIISRYFAASSPSEAKAARWIYIGFIQFTWISMATFGVLLRGAMPGIADPETGLVLFASQNIFPVATGIIFADIFATIASTSNGLLIAISQIIVKDLVPGRWKRSQSTARATSLVLGTATIFLSFILPGSVYSIAIDAVSMIGAGLGGPVIVKAFGMRHDAWSLLASFFIGLLAAIGWKLCGFSAILNEAGVGLAASLLTNFTLIRLWTANAARLAQP